VNLLFACFAALTGRISGFNAICRQFFLFPYWAVALTFVIFWIIRFVVEFKASALHRRYHLVYTPDRSDFPVRNLKPPAPQATPSGDITSASPITPQRTKFSFQHV
jgi:hypothetical protein